MLGHRREEILLAVVLSALAGFVDAIGFIAVGGFFISFMSGNTTRAAVALSEGVWDQLLTASTLIVAFLVGVVAGAVVGNCTEDRRRPAVLALVTVLLLVGAAAETAGAPTLAFAAVVAAAMGAENATFQQGGEVSIGLTYMTGTLVKMGQHFARVLIGEPNRVWLRYLVLWAGLSAGAVAGAFTYQAVGYTAFWLAAGAAAAATAVAAVRDL